MPQGARALCQDRALAGHVAHDQAEFVEAEEEVLQLLHAEAERGELALETLADFFERRTAVEHAEDRAFLVAEAKELERHGIVDDPVALRVLMQSHRQVGPHSDFERIHCGRTITAMGLRFAASGPDGVRGLPWVDHQRGLHSGAEF